MELLSEIDPDVLVVFAAGTRSHPCTPLDLVCSMFWLCGFRSGYFLRRSFSKTVAAAEHGSWRRGLWRCDSEPAACIQYRVPCVPE